MHIRLLVPDDPVWTDALFRMEQLLDTIHAFYLHDLPPVDAERVRTAYDGWGRIVSRLPRPLLHRVPALEVTRPSRDAGGYDLLDHAGRRLTQLYPLDIDKRDLHQLAAFQQLLDRRTADPRSALAQVAKDIAQGGGPERGDLRRALAVLQLRPDPSLVRLLAKTACGTDLGDVVLVPAQERHYRAHCEAIIRAVSGTDPWAESAHRMCYP
ncbi:hypothetical protein [Streptomyces minutiscleroticus]|uniref:hypothetical protein n=1 Tax=Streptomyces minutiscleroticus TaxID=68238 RepID=UPI00332F0219